MGTEGVETYLALGSDSDVSGDRSVALDGLLDAQVGQSVLPKDRARIQVCSHEPTFSRYGLLRQKQMIDFWNNNCSS